MSDSEFEQPCLIDQKHFHDDRGIFKPMVEDLSVFKQCNLSYSAENVLRGMHIQTKKPQGKLISVVIGKIYDAWIDLRKGSPTFLKWGAMPISWEDHKSLYIPPGFAHGFYVPSGLAVVIYHVTEQYDAASDAGVRWDDPEIGIDWPLQFGKRPFTSDRDCKLPFVQEYLSALD